MKKTMVIGGVLTALMVLMPRVSQAFCDRGNNICDLINGFGGLVRTGIGILSSLAVLVFIWGLVKYIIAAGDEASKASAKKIMVWGVVALFVLFSVFGLIKFLQNSFGITNNQGLPPPSVNF